MKSNGFVTYPPPRKVTVNFLRARTRLLLIEFQVSGCFMPDEGKGCLWLNRQHFLVLFLEFNFLINYFRLILDVCGFFFFLVMRLNPGPLNISDKHSATELQPLGYRFYYVVCIVHQFLGLFACIIKLRCGEKVTCGLEDRGQSYSSNLKWDWGLELMAFSVQQALSG